MNKIFTILFLILSLFNIINCSNSFFGLVGNNNEEEDNPEVDIDNPYDYGVDVTFPIHRSIKSNSYFGKRYNRNIKGCYEKFSKRECDANERARLEMNLEQPATQYNYTELGFKKVKIPSDIWGDILKFYNNNKYKQIAEKWPRGNTFVNSWSSPSYMISFEDKRLRGGVDLKTRIWNAMQPILEEWVGVKISKTSLYGNSVSNLSIYLSLISISIYLFIYLSIGIRVYKESSVLATHIDRLPLVSSCIIQVAQDVQEPWPLEVYSHDGKAYNITMDPGDVVLYESHSILHGRPFPLNGSNYANIFVHFAPVDHDENNKYLENNQLDNEEEEVIDEEEIIEGEEEEDKIEQNRLIEDQIKENVLNKAMESNQNENGIGGHEQANHDGNRLKRHLLDHDREMKRKRILFMKKEKEELDKKLSEATLEFDDLIKDKEEEEKEEEEIFNGKKVDGKTALHLAAAAGDLEKIVKMLDNQNTGKYLFNNFYLYCIVIY
jgi:hypothetical protein